MFSFVSRIRDYWFPVAKASTGDLLDKLNVVADISIAPVGAGTSLAPYVQTCADIFAQHHLKVITHAFGTNVEGSWNNIQEAVRDCQRTLHEKDKVQRVSTTIQLSTRVDKPQSLESRIGSVVQAV